MNMKLNIKKPYASIKGALINRRTGRQVTRRVRLLHKYKKKDYLTGSRSRPIPLCSFMIYQLIINA